MKYPPKKQQNKPKNKTKNPSKQTNQKTKQPLPTKKQQQQQKTAKPKHKKDSKIKKCHVLTCFLSSISLYHSLRLSLSLFFSC